MTPALASLLALLLAIVLSFVSRVNVGLLALPLAWAVGAYAGRPSDAVIGGFPTSLFITLAGVTLLFALAETNGTILQLATRLTGAARGRARLLPPIFFVIACALSTLGPGAIPAVALIVPIAIATGAPARIPVFLTALMVANGANAGNLSPVSAVGIIANTRMASVGLGGHEMQVWGANFLAHALVAGVAYVVLVRHVPARAEVVADRPVAFAARQWLTLATILGWIAAVLVFGAPLGLAAFAAAVVIIALRAADETS